MRDSFSLWSILSSSSLNFTSTKDLMALLRFFTTITFNTQLRGPTPVTLNLMPVKLTILRSVSSTGDWESLIWRRPSL